MVNKKLNFKKSRKLKIAAIYCFFFLLFFVLAGRLTYLMIKDGSRLKAVAAEQWTTEIKLNAKRGRILDRNDRELAVSADVYRIDLDIPTINQTLYDKKITLEQLESQLSVALNMDMTEVSKAFNNMLPNGKRANSAILKRRVEKIEADKVKALKIRGVLVSSDTKRYYPNDNFLANVLGHTDTDGRGLTGVELSYNKELAGNPGIRIYESDNKSNELPYETSQFTKPVNGNDIVLTIDETIQNFAEKAASKALLENKAKSVSITIMNPNDGEILAMTSKPDYNPNTPWKNGKTSDELESLWKNRSVQNTFEPGSIFKVMSAAAAMENGIGENDNFVCNGNLTIANRTISCWKTDGHGAETFADILKNSCNVGFMELGKELGKEKLASFARKVGFGQKTGIDLPGEAEGIVKAPAEISPVDLATFSFGQGISVTQVQYMAAFNAIANGGTWIKPHIMKEIIHYTDDNKRIIDKGFDDLQKKTIVSKNLTASLRNYLEKVVSEGVGSNAYIPGYEIAGKTGTAQKVNLNTGTYDAGKYMSSFAGMAPYTDPKVTLLITIDEPDQSNYYAGQTAAPVAKDLFNDIFSYMIINGEMTAPKTAKK